MTPDETAGTQSAPQYMTPNRVPGFLLYLNQIDPRFQLGTVEHPNLALHDLWCRALGDIEADDAREAVLAYYSAPLPQGVRERRRIEPHDLRRLVFRNAKRCEDHPEWRATKCLPCRDEVADGNRAPELYGRRKWPDAQTVERVDVSSIGQTPA